MNEIGNQQIQENEYQFPYHYLPHIDSNGVFHISRHLFWGHRYVSSTLSIKKELEKEAFKNLVDIGCGDGFLLNNIARSFKKNKLVGLDTSNQALKLADAFKNEENVEFIKKDITNSINDGEEIYDVATLIEVIEHIDPRNLDDFLASVKSIVKRGGRLIVTVPSKNIPVAEKHFQHFDKEELTELLSKHFKIENLYYLNDNGLISKLIGKLFSNRFFILNSSWFLKKLFNYYHKHCGLTKSKNSHQIMAVCRN